jgi:hypothetical protein
MIIIIICLGNIGINTLHKGDDGDDNDDNDNNYYLSQEYKYKYLA